MPYEFSENERELEPQASSARGGGPPPKLTGIGILDPPVPPKKPVGPIPSIPVPRWLRGFAGLLLFAILLGLFFFLFAY
ncbi:MAG TPA: hypothetical protein VH110_07700 [Candidatus Acidoferrum sp.]|nr:hypothetical protein [Candidatus Acidoferrum sp.]